MLCKNCRKIFRIRTEFLLHLSVCGQVSSKLSSSNEDEEHDDDKSESHESVDDSDSDPNWCPPINEIPDSECGSPVTPAQVQVAMETEALLIDVALLDHNDNISQGIIPKTCDNVVPDEPIDLTDLPPPSTTAARKSNAQKQRDYRQSIASLRTPAEVITAKAADTAKKRNYKLCVAANSALANGSLQSTTGSSSSATGRSTLATKPVQTTVQPSTSLDLVEEVNVRNQAFKTKLKILKDKIQKWEERKKIVYKEGKQSSARRIRKKIKNLEDVALSIEYGQHSLVEEVSVPTEKQKHFLDPVAVVEVTESSGNPSKHAKKNTERKKNYCRYCDKMVSRFARHVENVHVDKPEGKALSEINQNELSANKRIAKLKLTHNIKKDWNALYSLNYNSVIPVKKCKANGGKLVMCKYCSGTYARTKFSAHLKNCNRYKCLNEKSQKTRAIKLHSKQPLKVIGASDDLVKEILCGINHDPVNITAMSDPTIMLFTSNFHASRREPSNKDYVIREMRDLTKLFMSMRESNPKIESLKDCFNPLHFDLMIDSALKTAGYDPESGSVKVPSIAYRYSQPVKDAANYLKTVEMAAFYENGGVCRDKIVMIDDFIQLVSTSWKTKLGRICTKSKKHARPFRTDKMTVEKDIIKLAAYIEGSYRPLIKALNERHGNVSKNFDELTHSIVTHIMLLVRRRPVDFKHANIMHFQNIDVHDELLNMVEGINEVDLTACKRFHLFFVPGKNLEIVPMVMTPLMKTVMETLILLRHEVGIPDKCTTLFILSGGKFIDPSKSLKHISKNVNLLKPSHLTCNGLRHQAATFSRLQSEHPQYQDYLASVLGHTLSVHKKYYDLPTGVLQKVMVCPILESIMKGRNKNKEREQENLVVNNFDEDTLTEQHEIPSIEKKKTVDKIDNKYTQITSIPEEFLDTCTDVNNDNNNNDMMILTNSDGLCVPQTPIVRKRWSIEEEEEVLSHFGEAILKGNVPKRCEVRQFMEFSDKLANRTLDQVVLYIRNHALRRQQNVTPKVKKYRKINLE